MKEPLKLNDEQLADLMKLLRVMPEQRRSTYLAALANELVGSDHAVVAAEWPRVLPAAWNRIQNTIDLNKFSILDATKVNTNAEVR